MLVESPVICKLPLRTHFASKQAALPALRESFGARRAKGGERAPGAAGSSPAPPASPPPARPARAAQVTPCMLYRSVALRHACMLCRSGEQQGTSKAMAWMLLKSGYSSTRPSRCRILITSLHVSVPCSFCPFSSSFSSCSKVCVVFSQQPQYARRQT